MAVAASAVMAAARLWRQLGGGVAAAEHSATAAAWWQQRGGCGGLTGTVGECADAHAFERHRRADVRSSSLVEDRGTTAPTASSSAAATAAPVETSTTVANVPPPPMMTRPWRRPPRSPVRTVLSHVIQKTADY